MSRVNLIRKCRSKAAKLVADVYDLYDAVSFIRHKPLDKAINELVEASNRLSIAFQQLSQEIKEEEDNGSEEVDT